MIKFLFIIWLILFVRKVYKSNQRDKILKETLGIGAGVRK